MPALTGTDLTGADLMGTFLRNRRGQRIRGITAHARNPWEPGMHCVQT